TFYRPHIKKFREPIPNDNSQRTNIDHYVIRYADVLLMYAEVLNELNDNDKYTYINQVRQRAGLTPLANLSQEAFREHMYLERGWELAHEGDRRFDLVRWGIYTTRTPLWNPQVFGNIQTNKHEFWPIPQGQIDINPNLTQNPGY
ncbi:RagB/SusD family nutrient uptake outer membrane protein, partial [Haoranjiania flava]